VFRSLSRLPAGLADGLAKSGTAPGSRYGRLAARFAPATASSPRHLGPPLPVAWCEGIRQVGSIVL